MILVFQLGSVMLKHVLNYCEKDGNFESIYLYVLIAFLSFFCKLSLREKKETENCESRFSRPQIRTHLTETRLFLFPSIDNNL